ncbi:hypothetical protein NEHOM01_1047 [Nematocida homosporus]|uniref:uncharacterized protein n=1 Tax=Nematocida homosporus TaxID=1912981 RepID=UPI0022205F48|nr:uncharacterized protein NEHOM01_1047 [Nematocida homosporus]KAI5185770.1 hypothetical protein NEHOM01_1047 [Nematocida homosporus]
MANSHIIAQIEDDLVNGKAWYEKGEVTIKDRPKGTLVKPLVKEEKIRKRGKDKVGRDKVGKEEEIEEEDYIHEDLEFVRNKTTLKITEKVSSLLERIVKDKIKKKEYDNPRKVQKKSKEELAKLISSEITKTEEPERGPLHDVYAGRRTENDQFMAKAQLVALFNEIDKELSAITDHTYTASRPIILPDDIPTNQNDTDL